MRDRATIMTNVEMLRFWEGHHLRRWPASVVHTMEVSDTDKEFLLDVGFALDLDWNFEFDHDPRRMDSPSRCWLIGYDDPIPLCIDEATEAVVALEDALGLSTRFVNTSVRCFGECLVHYATYRRVGRTLDDHDDAAARSLIDEVSIGIAASDPAALGSAENYWSVIVEQMRYGLL